MFQSKVSTVRSSWGEFSSIQTSNAPGFIPIPCPSHPQYSITNICKTPNCIEPLCPQCITHHVQLHQQTKKPAKIENIVTTRLTCIEQLAKMKYQSQKQFSQSVSQSSGNIQEFVRKHQQKIEIAHKKISKLVEDMFEKFYKKMEAISIAFSVQKQKRQKQAKIKLSPLKQYVSKISQYKLQLESDDYIPALIQLLNEPPKKPKVEGLAQIQKFGSVEINEKYFEEIKSSIENFIKIKSNIKEDSYLKNVGTNNLRFSRFDQSRSRQKVRDSSINSSRGSGSRSKIFSRGKQNKQDSSLKIFEKSTINYNKFPLADQFLFSNKEKSIKILKSSYFLNERNVNIVTFEEGSRHCFVANLAYLEAGFSKIDLQIDQSIPFYHRSITLPTGEIILLGGQYEDKYSGKMKSSQKFFRMIGKRFEELMPMKEARAKFGMCYHKEAIYCFGGVTNTLTSTSSYNQFPLSKTCEVFSFNQAKWRTLSPMPEGVYNFEVCPLSNNRIIKLGGILQTGHRLQSIDIYDIQYDNWSRIEISSNLQLPFRAGIVNISDGEILFFGGINNKTSQKTTRAYLVSQVEGRIEVYPAKQLYNEASFENCYIGNNSIIAIQQGQIGRNKIIMGFKHQQWKFIAC